MFEQFARLLIKRDEAEYFLSLNRICSFDTWDRKIKQRDEADRLISIYLFGDSVDQGRQWVE